MCGIAGIISDNDKAGLALYDALSVLQHRGQDAAGIVTCSDSYYNIHKGMGLVRDVFKQRDMERLFGHYGIGHVRYPTAGKITNNQTQPFYVNAPYGIFLAHNGNIVNTGFLREYLKNNSNRHINTTSDSELLLNIFAHCLRKSDSVFDAVDKVHELVVGAYSVIVMVVGHGIVAFRDPHGIRPLVYGTKGNRHMFASESVALECLGYKLERDVYPAETIFVNINGEFKSRISKHAKGLHPCIFEFVYLARPDSTIDNINVYQSRRHMGTYLGKKIKNTLTTEELDEIDVIIPVPDTGRNLALSVAIELNKPLREGFVKNRYVGRTFIMPGQEIRKQSIRKKLNTIKQEFQGKNVLLIDDSIVRGNTSQKIIEMVRKSGARKVFFASAAPPIRHQNVYGIDMPYLRDLIAYEKTIKEVGDYIGCDKLIYQDVEDLISAVKESNPSIKSFDTSCFDGIYITGKVDEKYLDDLHINR